MSDIKSNIKKKGEFVIFERGKISKKVETKAIEDVKKERNTIGRLGKKIKEQEHQINEKLKKIEKKQEEKLAKKRERKEDKKLDNLAKMTENRLFKLTAVWPFDFFPNQIYIEEKQIIIVYKQFFFVSQNYNILIQDILVPIVENSLLFSTLKIQLGPGGFQQDPPPIRFLPKKDAIFAKHIIMGLLVCHKEKINLDNLKKEEVIDKLIEIGRYRED